MMNNQKTLANIPRQFDNLEMDKLHIGANQMRTRDTDAGIEELAKSIETVGLLEPIVVVPNNVNEYEIITGQRRFLACERLGWDSIPAMILERKPDNIESLTISVTENLLRRDPSEQDYIDACTKLHDHYGSVEIVSKMTGLSQYYVNQYVKAPQLSESLRRKYNNGDINLKTALAVNDASRLDSGKNEEFGDLIAEKIIRSGMGQQQAVNFAKAAQKEANRIGVEAITEEVFDRLVKPKPQRTLPIQLETETDDALSKFAETEGTGRKYAGNMLITEGLQSKGYLDREED